ncbi:trNA pseudouridine synthase A 2 [Waddlia chondrophila 2032/99]|uniref:tRNA pseudouridine synthase A n=1 Tax=Waddlia chondrophila 2032/99 TaxID=765953 RepID=F8LCH0_9BACT|nr:trNA pseudouridine synthase A 2 [Waddlia chondrophila 2032/99]
MSQHFNFLLTIAYDGTPFLGWQETKEGPSIEGELKKALRIILKEEIKLNGASRTDAGVHALGQLANFHTTKKPHLFTLLKSINALLPDEIKVTAIEEVEASFHATLDNTGKQYRYRLSFGPVQFPHVRHREWHIPGKLDIETMRLAAKSLEGTHDFKAFCNVKKNDTYDSTIRTLSKLSLAELENDTLEVIMEGNHFLYKMARNIVGTLVYIGKKRIQLNTLKKLVLNGDRTQLGPTAPAHGLTLFHVFRHRID